MTRRDLPLLRDKKAREILGSLCEEHDVSLDLIESLLDIQRDNLGRGKQIGISQEFSAALSEFIDERAETQECT